MKYLKTYENQTLEEIKKIQASKRAILRFFDKVIEISKKYYKIKLKFSAGENRPGNYDSLTYYQLSIKNEKVCEASILRNIKHKVRIILNHWGVNFGPDFYDFMVNFLNIEDKYNMMIYFCTSEELNELSDKLLDEFDMYMMAKKYNIG